MNEMFGKFRTEMGLDYIERLEKERKAREAQKAKELPSFSIGSFVKNIRNRFRENSPNGS